MEHLKEATLKIWDLECKVCVRRVLDVLRAVEGVVAVRVSTSPTLDEQQPGLATVKYDPGLTDIQALTRAVEAIGYPVASASLAG